MPGVPAQAHINDAAGIPRPQPQDIPISQREPPENWPGFLKSWYKLGRGGATAIDGAADLAKKTYENPEKIPGGMVNLGEHAYHDQLGRSTTPSGYIWHHVEDGRTMELVPKKLHETVRHTGGVPAAKNHNIGLVAPGGVFTPLEQRFAVGGGAAGGLAGGPAVTEAGP